MIKNSYPISLCLVIAISVCNYQGAMADEPNMSPELRQSLVGLMELLAPEPVVNKGSDGVLTSLSDETPDVVEHGQQIYSSHCAACHGTELQGQPEWDKPGSNGMLPAPPHDDSGHTWHHADDQLFEIVKYGAPIAMRDPEYRSMMPAFDAILSNDDINAVLVFIRSVWSDENKKWQQGANDAQTGNEWWRDEVKPGAKH